MKKQIVLLAIMLPLCLQGCGIFYVPSFSGKFNAYDVNTSKREIDDFLEIGKTTQDEIQSALGCPNSIDINRNIWAYIGTRISGYWFGFNTVLGHSAEIVGGSVRKNMLLLIKFDKDDCLKRYDLNMLAVDFVLDSDIKQQVAEWDNSFETQPE